MSWIQRVFLASVAKKWWMGITGLGLCGFIAFHLTANLLFFLGPNALNKFSWALEKIPILAIIEAALYALFLLHIFLGVVLWFDNRRARAGSYKKYGTKKGGVETTVSKTMIWSGLVVLVFIALHVTVFRFGTVDHDAFGLKDFHSKNVDVFSNGLYSLWYVLGVIVLAFHVSHGFQSAFRSIGVNHDVYTPALEWISRAAGVIVGVGFGSIPIYVYLFLRGA
ncbi:MAG: succinate dehydrogenase cytochrome b subunit [Candidatus Eisenbacteria bacterium]|nr:succinate dehydrogenase cytochrome b subunit [Candidatus Eisenbacteria bacterium]